MIRSWKAIDVEAEGLRALRDRLGPSGMLAFLRNVNGGGRGDYTAERARLFQGQSVRDLAERINAPRNTISVREWIDRLFEQARQISCKSEQDQETWIAHVTASLHEQPALAERVVSILRGFIAVARQRADHEVQFAHEEEMFEAALCSRLEELLESVRKQPASRGPVLEELALIAVAGHILPNLRARLQQDDAQSYLAERLGDIGDDDPQPGDR